ncbi:MAG: MMPL family transporter, partial [Sphingomonadales bacterium]
MARVVTGIDRFALRLSHWVVAHRWLVIILSLVLVSLAGAGGRHLAFSSNYRIFFSDQNPELVAFEDFQATYTKNDNILFVIQPAKGSVFEPEVLAAIEALTEKAWQIPYASRVDSITNFQHSRAEGDNLIVEDLVRGGAEMDRATREAKKATALAEPLLNGSLLAPDTRTTGVNVTLQYPELTLTEVPEAVAVARKIAAEMRADLPGVTVAMTGVSMLNNAFAESGRKDTATLIPAMYMALLVLLFVVLRSFATTLVVLMVIGFSTIVAMGLAGHMGILLNPISVAAPTVILTLAIADSVHILVSLRTGLKAGLDKIEAIHEALRINFLAVSVTSLTTVVGFMALNFSDSPPFQNFGNITAMGIVAAWALSIFFLPAAMSLVSLKAPADASPDRGLEGLLTRLANLVIARKRAVLVTMGALVLFFIALVPGLDLNDEFVKYFDHRIEFRTHSDFASENLTGVYLAEYSVPAEEPGAVSEPVYLERLAAFTAWLRAQPEVTHVFSYTDIAKRLNRNMHGDDPDWYRVPETRQMAAQYLLLYEISLPYGLDLNDRINIDKSATRVTTTMGAISTVEIREFLERSETWLIENTPDYMHTKATGATVMFSFISMRNINSMLTGNIIAVIAIALIMAVTLRSVGFGLLSLVPNAVPILVAFGVWALLVGYVGMAA